MSLAAFALAVLLLLLTPGPTNTLLAVAGASRGVRSSLPLVGAEVGGYLTSVVPLVFIAAPLLADQPTAALVVKLASTVWVLILAARLWNHPPSVSEPGAVTPLNVYATTVLNPKGLIIGLVLIPSAPLDSPLSPLAALAGPLNHIAVFVLLITIVALSWLFLGSAVLRHVARARPLLFGRVAASFLAVFAMSLAGRAIGWI